MRSPQRKAWRVGLVVAILALAAGLRFWRMDDGLPRLYLNDEALEIQRAFAVLRGELHYLPGPKGFLLFIMAAEYAVHGAISVLLGRAESFDEYISQAIADPGTALLIGRTNSALFGVASVFLCYLAGSRIFRRELPALCLAIFWATAAQSVWLSHWYLIEPLLALLAIGVLLASLSILESGRKSAYVAAALLAAGATACKIYAGLLLALPWLAHLLADGPLAAKHRLARLRSREVWGMTTLYLVAWVIFAPGMAVYGLQLLGVQFENKTFVPESEVPPRTHMALYWTHLRWQIGTLALPFCGIGVLAAFLRGQRGVTICAVFSLLFVIALGSIPTSTLYSPRYLLLSLPFFAILGLYGAGAIGSLCSLRLPLAARGAVRAAMLGLFTAAGVANSGETILSTPHFQPDLVPVEAEALEWFESEVPAGSKVFLLGGLMWPGHQTLPLWDLRENYLARYEEAVRSRERQNNLSLLKDLAGAAATPRFDLTIGNIRREIAALEEYLDEGVEYFVVDPDHHGAHKAEQFSDRTRRSRERLYQELGSSGRAELVKTFAGQSFTYRERRLEVYRRRGPAGE